MGDETKIHQPDIEPIKGGKYRLREDYSYETEITPDRFVKIDIEKGFEYDGASVPRAAWSLSGIKPDGLIRAAALVHDYLYTTHAFQHRFPEEEYEEIFCYRKEADNLFLKIIFESEMKKHRAKMAYWAVRMFGMVAWRIK